MSALQNTSSVYVFRIKGPKVNREEGTFGWLLCETFAQMEQEKSNIRSYGAFLPHWACISPWGMWTCYMEISPWRQLRAGKQWCISRGRKSSYLKSSEVSSRVAAASPRGKLGHGRRPRAEGWERSFQSWECTWIRYQKGYSDDQVLSFVKSFQKKEA